MAKVKRCLDDACTRYYWTDDDKVIVAPRDVCDTGLIKGKSKNPKSMSDFRERFNQMVTNAKRTIYVSNDPGWKEGDDATL